MLTNINLNVKYAIIIRIDPDRLESIRIDLIRNKIRIDPDYQSGLEALVITGQESATT